MDFAHVKQLYVDDVLYLLESLTFHTTQLMCEWSLHLHLDSVC